MEVNRTLLKIARAFLFGLCVGVLGVYTAFFVLADTDPIRPDGDGTTVAGTAVGCTSSLRWECLNEVITQPTAPDTGTDYLQQGNNDVNYSQLGNIPDIDTATSVTIWIYHREGGTNARTNVGFYAANETTAYGGPTTLTYRSSAQWDPVTYTGLSLTEAQLDAAKLRINCSKQGGGASNDCFAYAAYVDVNYSKQIEATVSATGTQQNLDIGTTSAHIGAAFSITENVSSRNVTSITIEETGTVDAATNLDNIKLFYDLDTSDPYNCDSETYSPSDSQFGSTDTDGFSSANGTSTFTGTVGITTTQTMCVYVVLDIATTSSAGQTIEVEIDDPSTDVVVSGSGDVDPSSPVALAGSTIIQAQDRDQIHYHWRNDNGNENNPGGATSATGGTDDTTLDTLSKTSQIRLRLQVSNEGNRTSDSTQYRLEYGRKISTCSAVATDSSWIDVGAGGGDWDMFDSSNLTDGNDTTDIAESIGGMPNENFNFLTNNNAIKDTSSQTSGFTLSASEFAELEYSIQPTANATEGYTYCFRLTNADSEIETYSIYPEATILADVNVTTANSQRATVDIPTPGVDVGADFIFTDNIAGNTTIQSITITASSTGSINADFEDIELWYDLDTTGGDSYNCSDESYSGDETQFGTTAANFSAAGTSTFTGSQVINPTQTMCLYVVYTASSTITDGEKIDFRINDASADVAIDAGTVSPAAQVNFSGTTQFVTDIPAVTHYHWRNDDGTEVTATAATSAEDVALENLRAGVPARLRFGVVNEGSSTTPAYQFRLEYGLKVSTCAAASYTDVGAADDEFNMFNSGNITDGDDTTNIAVSSGGISDPTPGYTFITNNNAVKDTSSQVASQALPGKNYTDLEFAIVASSTATEGATYCLRITDAGDDSVLRTDVYAEVSIKPATDYFIQRGTVDVSGTSATINAGTEYVAPASSSTAFIRIVGTNNTGAGSPTNSGNTDDVTVYISNPSNITSSITFTRPGTAADTTRVAYEIIEYVGAPGGDNEIVVRQQTTATYGTGNTTVTTGAASGIADDNDVAVFITGQMNPDIGKNYPLGISTAAWNSGADTVTFTRGVSGNAAVLSYAVVEFVGDNWTVQRAENTYTAAGSNETQALTNPVGSLSRAFLHAQKRIGSGLTNHSDFGHTVYLSGIGQVTFALDAGASTPGSHTSVAWVIENTQTVGEVMAVYRSNNSETGGASPKLVTNNIGATISDTQDASLFINNFGDEINGTSNANTFPEPILSGRLLNNTQHQYYVGDPDQDSRTWRAEVVEWPTAARDITQNDYYFFADNGLATVTDPWPPGPGDVGENGEVLETDGPIALNEIMRLRMTLQISSAGMEPGIDNFKLQYGERVTTCTAIAEDDWFDVGEIGSTTALWRGTSTADVADGFILSSDPPAAGALKITSVADVAATYEAENPSAFTPYVVDPGEDVEFDWAVQHNGAKEKTSYCFRMMEADGEPLEDWLAYPTMRTAGYTPRLENWRWYDDETSVTPTVDLAGTNTAPIDIALDNIVKLRTTVKELTGGEGTNIKFKLQYSEQSDFSSGVFDVASSTFCAGAGSTTANVWCYADGNGVDNAVIDDNVLADADACTAGSGDGCGTHNESKSTTTATFDQLAYSTTEYEFTLRHDGARANAVYYFRLYDLNNATSVPASTTYPSVVTEGAALTFTLGGVDSGEVIDGETIDVSTATTSISFGEVPFDTEYTGAYRLNVDTNATEGYKVLMLFDQQLTSSFGAEIEPITGTNATPVGWSAGCSAVADSCFGYHVEDDILEGGSSRFGADDTYAAVSTTTPEEVMFSSVPTEDVHDIVFKLEIREGQPPGDYLTNMTLISIPIF